MSIYAIGDVQGCFDALQRLLDQINFNETKDTLWFAGDLVNRGPQSLETLRFIQALGDSAKCVLGNHDLHLMALHFSDKKPKSKDTLGEILNAPDRDELFAWLRQQSLIHHDSALGFTMVHAGIPPQWTLSKALSLGAEVERCLISDNAPDYFANMYGNKPDIWDDALTGMDRLRVITNYFTRMRFCSPEGHLNMTHKQGPEDAPEGMLPWYVYGHRKMAEQRIIFGHWAALLGKTNHSKAFALDTGCVWGYELTAMRLEDQKRFSVQA